MKNILLPLGISFFTFQQIAYIVDSYRGKTKEYGIVDYALYILFFPQLVAGPIVLHDEMIPQFSNRRNWIVNWDNISSGIMIFTYGLFKKTQIADMFGRYVDRGFLNVKALSSGDIWLLMLSYTVQIYCDFSGYSDMAIGIGKMFNFELPLNFDFPYRSCSIVEFWKRWHITLTRFLRQYVYFPLGGSRCSSAKTYLNVFLVFLVSGIWHGANWTFILWGVLHGLAYMINRTMDRIWQAVPKVMRWFTTFLFVNIAWLLFRADSILQWCDLLKKAFHPDFTGFSLYYEGLLYRIAYHLSSVVNGYIPVSLMYGIMMILCAIFIIIVHFMIKERYYAKKTDRRTLIITFVVLMVCILSLGRESAFIYFNF